jgi:hypothetical protein
MFQTNRNTLNIVQSSGDMYKISCQPYKYSMAIVLRNATLKFAGVLLSVEHPRPIISLGDHPQDSRRGLWYP